MRRRPRRLHHRRPPLTEAMILAWADYEYEQTGRWPGGQGGPVLANLNEKWHNLNAALHRGQRGLAGGDSVARLLARARGVRNLADLPTLTADGIIAWADLVYAQTGQWPNCVMEDVAGQPGEKWCNIDQSLREGARGLPGGSSLPQLLEQRRGVRNRSGLAPLSDIAIAAWARAHHVRSGEWPTAATVDPVPESPGDTWADIATAVEHGSRGVVGEGSLSGLLARLVGTYNHKALPRLTVKNIVAWAVQHRRRNGSWPRVLSGVVEDAPEETWLGIDSALREGLRGLKGGTSLAQVLARHRQARNRAALPLLAVEQIEAWIDAHQRRTGAWPTQYSGPIPRSGGETWGGVQMAMRVGMRGLPGGDSIHQLLLRTGRKATGEVRHLDDVGQLAPPRR